MRTIILLGGAALLLAGCQGQTDNQATVDDMGDNLAMSTPNAMEPASPIGAAEPTVAADYLAQAGAGDMFEIESSRVVLDKTGNNDVRQFAQMMIKDHGKSTEDLKAAAANAGITVAAPALSPDQQRMLDEIKSATAETLDATYVRNQKAAHAAALALHQSYAANGDTPALREAAGKIATVVQHHIERLDQMPVG